MSTLRDRVPIPPKDTINTNLSSATEKIMLRKFGNPGALTKDCSAATGRIKARIKSGVDVGPFKVSGLDFAVESLRQIFAEVEEKRPHVFKEVKTAGMLCVRHRRSNPARFSNHSWGAAIDLFFGTSVVPQGTELHRIAAFFCWHPSSTGTAGPGC